MNYQYCVLFEKQKMYIFSNKYDIVNLFFNLVNNLFKNFVFSKFGCIYFGLCLGLFCTSQSCDDISPLSLQK